MKSRIRYKSYTSRLLRLLLIGLISIFQLPARISAQCEILLWEENFDGPALNADYWNILNDNSGGGNNELQYYTPRDTNLYIENGKLIFRALKESFDDREYTSAKITTKGLVDLKYGRIEAKIKLPEGQGIWPAFWMLPSLNKYGGWPNSGEIDIVELVGQDPSTVYGTLHYGPPWNYTNGLFSLDEGKFSDSAHVFGFEWTADSMIWYVDDQPYSYKKSESLVRPEQWKIFRERFYLILNLAVGGNWPGKPDETTPFPARMEVDYIRVYGDPANQEIIAKDSAYAMAKGITYSFSDVPGASFNWSVPEGAVIVNGQGTARIEVNWGCNPGNVSLNLSELDCEDMFYSLPVEFAALDVSGPEASLPLEQLMFLAPDLTETNFTWEYPEDAELLGDPGDTLLLKWGCSEGMIRLITDNTCGVLEDSVEVRLQEPRIYGPVTISQNSQNILFTVDEIPETDYIWSLPSDASIINGQGTDSIYADFGLESGAVSVELSNVCYTNQYDIQIRITDTLLLTDFETSVLLFETFSSTSFEISDNPVKDIVNSSVKTGKSFKSEVPWSGIYTDLGYNLDLSRHNIFRLKVLGPKNGPVLLKLEDIDVGSAPSVEIPADYQDSENWQDLEFIFPGVMTDVYDRLTIFFDFGSSMENTYYFDDLKLLPSANIPVELPEADWEYLPYPNPFHHSFRILSEYNRGAVIQLRDLNGRIVYKEKIDDFSNEIIPGEISQGVYILSVSTDDNVHQKLVIKY